MFDENAFDQEAFSSDSWFFATIARVRQFILLQASKVTKVFSSGSTL